MIWASAGKKNPFFFHICPNLPNDAVLICSKVVGGWLTC